MRGQRIQLRLEFTYTKGGRTSTATTPAGTTSYKYDGDGRRLSATLGTAKTSFEWDPFYRLANELDTSGALVRHYTHGDQPLTSHDASGAAAYFHADRLGSVRAVTDAAGAVTSAGAWEPYGRPRATGPNNPNAPPLGWLGQYQDPTGLTHLRARQHDPTAGMFLSPDPAASTSFSGTYTYATANPLRYIDITGLFSWDEVLGGVQNVSGIVSDVAGVVAIVALATGVGAPIAAIAGGISIAAGAVHAGTKAIQAYDTCNSGKGSCGDAVAEALMSTVAIVPGGRLIKGAASGVKALSNASKGADEAGALVRYDPKFASRNLLGQAGDGYARTPGGRTLSVHAAERILHGGPGRPPTTMERVDDILDKPTSVKWNPANRTVQVNQGKAYVAVRDSGPQQHIVTVMVP